MKTPLLYVATARLRYFAQRHDTCPMLCLRHTAMPTESATRSRRRARRFQRVMREREMPLPPFVANASMPPPLRAPAIFRGCAPVLLLVGELLFCRGDMSP